MPAALDHWQVMPHGPLDPIDDGILTVAGEIVMPLGRFPRRMTVIRLADGGTLIWSAIALREPEMQQIESLGMPAFWSSPTARTGWMRESGSSAIPPSRLSPAKRA